MVVSNKSGVSGHGKTPSVGLSPQTPVAPAGMRTEPARSVPSASAPQPVASPAAAPPDEPPGVVSGSHGLRVSPQSGLELVPLWPHSAMLVMPRRIAPDALSRSTTTVSAAGTLFSNIGRAEGDPHSRDVDHVLDGVGNAVERAERVAAGDGLLGLLRMGARLFRAHDGEGVERRLHRLGAGEDRVDQIDRRQVAGGDPSRGLGPRQEAEVFTAHVACSRLTRTDPPSQNTTRRST